MLREDRPINEREAGGLADGRVEIVAHHAIIGALAGGLNIRESQDIAGGVWNVSRIEQVARVKLPLVMECPRANGRDGEVGGRSVGTLPANWMGGDLQSQAGCQGEIGAENSAGAVIDKHIINAGLVKLKIGQHEIGAGCTKQVLTVEAPLITKRRGARGTDR